MKRELAEERALKRVFGMVVTPKLLDRELDRVEKTTKAPEQWEAIKKALGNDRRLIEEVFCRPLLVDRALHARFAFDQTIHAGPHQEAREARAALLAGRPVAQARIVRLMRKPMPGPTTAELLNEAREDSSLPRAVPPAKDAGRRDEPLSLDSEERAVLERELRRPGDVTSILETREGFHVFRLVEISHESWTVEMVSFPKVEFESWFGRQATK